MDCFAVLAMTRRYGYPFGVCGVCRADPTRYRRLPSRHLLRRRDIHRQLAVAILEGFGVDFLELDRTAHHGFLPCLMLGVVLEFRHHFLAEQLERLTDVLMGVLAGLVEQDHLVDMGGAE